MKTVASFLSPSPASFRALPVSMPGRVDTRVPPPLVASCSHCCVFQPPGDPKGLGTGKLTEHVPSVQ